MCHTSCVVFGANNLKKEEIRGKRVIEIGSYDQDGSLRYLLEPMKPSAYVGVDIHKGPGVDAVCSAEDVVERFGKNSFDTVIATELLEHVRDWRRVISNIKNVCKPKGLMLITTRSYGFDYHGAPYDYWRYEPEDMLHIFSDCKILKLEKDLQLPGVFIKAMKPDRFREKDLSNYKLYSIIADRKVRDLTTRDFISLRYMRLILRTKLWDFLRDTGRMVILR